MEQPYVYVYKPYPKMLYRNGEYRTADGYSMECELKDLGYGYGPDWVWPQPESVVVKAPVKDDETPAPVDAPQDAPVAEVKRKRGRPRKVTV